MNESTSDIIIQNTNKHRLRKFITIEPIPQPHAKAYHLGKKYNITDSCGLKHQVKKKKQENKHKSVPTSSVECQAQGITTPRIPQTTNNVVTCNTPSTVHPLLRFATENIKGKKTMWQDLAHLTLNHTGSSKLKQNTHHMEQQ